MTKVGFGRILYPFSSHDSSVDEHLPGLSGVFSIFKFITIVVHAHRIASDRGSCDTRAHPGSHSEATLGLIRVLAPFCLSL